MIQQDETGKWNNRAEDIVAIVPYDPCWAYKFADEHRAIRDCMDASIPLVIEHFGSTAIPGMPAKPIIDVLIGASSRYWPAILEALKALNYIHWEENPNRDREFLVKGMPPFGLRRTHHVHIMEVGSLVWEQLLFRDYLREHPEERIRYADLKQRLAVEFRTDREAYTDRKAPMIAEILNRARTWRHR